MPWTSEILPASQEDRWSSLGTDTAMKDEKAVDDLLRSNRFDCAFRRRTKDNSAH